MCDARKIHIKKQFALMLLQWNLTNSELAISHTTDFFMHYDLDDHIATT
jgi:hypothetical protein